MLWTWLYMSLEALAFLVLSAVMFRVVTRADAGPAASRAQRAAASHGAAAEGTRPRMVTQLEVARR